MTDVQTVSDLTLASNGTEPAEALEDRLFQATIGTLELFSIHLGRRLGLYRLLGDGEPRTVAQLASEADIAVRYAREWLEQQAVAGLVGVDETDDADRRRYHLSASHARVLADEADPIHVAPFASMVAGIGQALPEVVDAYRTGAGVAYPRFGSDFREGQGGINRPAFTHDLVDHWLPSVPDIHARLTAGARVADIGCGLGWAAQAIARAYPRTEVTGIDADAASVRDAEAALEPELHGRVRYVTGTAAEADAVGPFDVVVLLETLHDIGDPGAGLAGIRAALADDGIVLVADEAVADAFTAPGDDIERMMFGWSVVHCLPAAVAEGGHGAVGTAIRPDVVRELATEAGFRDTQLLPVDAGLFHLYRLVP